NGQYRAHDGAINTLPQGQKMYSTLSLWDTFRSWHPLMTLIDKELTENIVRSMLAMYEATGELPIWPLASGETGTMIGYHSVSVIADAYLKEIRGFDAEKAFEAMKVSSNTSRKGGEYYVQNGFIPTNIKKESVSCLLEYAYDDWCIAQMAKALEHEADYREYTRRAQSYMNVFDGNTGFFRGKREDGNWENPFDPFEAGRAYTEANAWQYRFAVPHDINGLVQLLGGNELFSKALDDLFSESGEVLTDIPDITGLIGQYAHGNEPSHHMAYLYSYIGQPWKTQQRVRQILQEMYSARPDGIVGNEDCGQMSAWYLMSSLGLYPVTPGSGEYVLSSPLFSKASIQLHNGKVLQIKANDPAENIYIKSETFNGKPVEKTFIAHETLMQGGTLEIELDIHPYKHWGVKAEEHPYSMSAGQQVSVPYVKNDLQYFIDKIDCELGCRTEGAVIRYTLDGSAPDENSARYEKPFTIDRDMKLTARAFKAGYKPSPIFSVQAVKAVFRKADRQSATNRGVSFKYYEGEFSSVDELASSPVVKKGTLSNVNIKITEREDDFGLEFNGFIAIPEDGVYEFYTETDDGSTLTIGETTVVYNDGSHAAIRATGRIPLRKGLHRFRLRYFEDYEGQKLDWGWKKPGKEKWQPIAKEHLFVRN
ncbi:MAG: GH92 family glycosyl hydrolase, partial [Draconibacterium sp.]